MIGNNSKLNQQKNTNNVINRFKNEKFSFDYRFITFGIVKFYLSITTKTLIKAFEFAENFLPITDKYINLIVHSF